MYIIRYVVIVMLSLTACKAKVKKLDSRERAFKSAIEANLKKGQGSTRGFQLTADKDYARLDQPYLFQAYADKSFGNSMLTALIGGYDVCLTKMSLQLSEEQKDLDGSYKRVKLMRTTSDVDIDLWIQDASNTVDATFYHNTWNRAPVVHMRYSVDCSTTETYYSGGKMKRRTNAINFYWDCQLDESSFPANEGQRKTAVKCEAKSNFSAVKALLTGGLVSSFLLSKFDKTDFYFDITKKKPTPTWDANNCEEAPDKQKPFYMRISRGLEQKGTNEFLLNVYVDNQSLPELKELRTQTKSGLYSLALAYCPDNLEQEKVSVYARGLEEDVFFDDYYFANNQISLARGDSGIIDLKHDGITDDLGVLQVDVFKGDEGKAEEEVKKDAEILSDEKQLVQSREDLMYQISSAIKDLSREYDTCLNTGVSEDDKKFVTETIQNYGFKSYTVVDSLFAIEGEAGLGLIKAPKLGKILGGAGSSVGRRTDFSPKPKVNLNKVQTAQVKRSKFLDMVDNNPRLSALAVGTAVVGTAAAVSLAYLLKNYKRDKAKADEQDKLFDYVACGGESEDLKKNEAIKDHFNRTIKWLSEQRDAIDYLLAELKKPSK